MMVDILTKERRSWNMSRIRGKDTGPEKRLRSLLHRAGFRFRLHQQDLAGRPDIVLPRYSTAIFVHGCYWHRHPGCRHATTPSSNRAFWLEKFAGTVTRDKRNREALEATGWAVAIVWECELNADPDGVLDQLRNVLGENE
jgi:DNA mismatch endonuclease (patch repair protein)